MILTPGPDSVGPIGQAPARPMGHRSMTSPQLTGLTLAQLTDIYDCTLTNWDQVGGSDARIGVVLPQSGSGTARAGWGNLGITAASEPCWQNGTVTVNGVSTVIQENTGLTTGNVAQFTTKQSFGTTYAGGSPRKTTSSPTRSATGSPKAPKPGLLPSAATPPPSGDTAT